MLLFQATLESNKLDLAWTLLRKQRKDTSVQKLDKKGRNLLHLVAIHSAKLWTQVVEKVTTCFIVVVLFVVVVVVVVVVNRKIRLNCFEGSVG